MDPDDGIDKRHHIWQVVASIPPGKVASYGQVASLAGLGRGARLVGKTLGDLPSDTRIPWHRVVNSQGRISLPTDSGSHATQRQRLEEEGIEFNRSGTINFSRFGWNP